MEMPPTALVTGGGRRVGRAVVERLATAGYRVAFTYNRSAREAEAVRARLADGGHDVSIRHADFLDNRSLDAAVDWARERFDRLDLLVNCASLFLPDGDETAAALQTRTFAVNCVAPTALTLGLAEPLRLARGCVVNFLDLLGERPWPKYSAYCASKAALHSITLSHARLLAPHVRVNGIAPGVIDWPDDMPEIDRGAYLKKIPLGRAGTPADAAELVLQLAASMPYVTGQVIRLDGGRSLV